MRKPVRMISAADIKQFYSMQQAIDAMERAFSSLASKESYVPLRSVYKFPSNDVLLLFKPACVQKDNRISVKFLTQRENGFLPGIPTIQGILLLIDSLTGELLSIMDGEYLTALRTGAASGLATRLFARKDAQTMALFGCGAQGRTQVMAVLCERDIKKIYVYDVFKPAADKFINDMREKLDVEILHVDDLSRLQEADIICTATNSKSPLFKKEHIKSGVHINAIGSFQPHMQEIDPFIIRDATVFVDQIDSCIKESGDLIKPIEDGIIDENHIAGEIGDLCLKKETYRKSENEITLFKSVGVAIQDLAVATDIYNNSLDGLFGNEIRLFE